MRGGTSRGLYFLKKHLPDRDVWPKAMNELLLTAMGSPHSCQIDGLGGGASTTSKVAIISKSEASGVDVDYQFAQVSVTNDSVDWDPPCGNILAGVGPAAIEMGLIEEVGTNETTVKIRSLNNHSLIEACVQTPNKQVEPLTQPELNSVSSMAFHKGHTLFCPLNEFVGPSFFWMGMTVVDFNQKWRF